MDAFALDGLDERSLRHSSSRAEPAGAVACAAWTDRQRRYGADRDVRLGPEPQDGAAIRVSRPAEVYARDEFVYWAFGDAGRNVSSKPGAVQTGAVG